MQTRLISTAILAVLLAVFSACGGSDPAEDTQVDYGTYLRLADPSFESIEDCEAQKLEADEGTLFNCSQRLTLNEDGTFFRILTDIAEPGTFTIEDSTLVLTQDLDGSTSEIPINDDGTLGDGWELDPESVAEE